MSRELVPSSEQSDLRARIDEWNEEFTSRVRFRLQDLSRLGDDDIAWLMLEHYQFSERNCSFLSASVHQTRSLRDAGISIELERNLNEESGHSVLYRKALRQVGVETDQRVEFSATSRFFNKLSRLIAIGGYTTLGVLYATESAAIFEHEVFRDLSRELLLRKGLPWQRSKLKAFHDLHLNGVEQEHKDGLAIFVDRSGEKSNEVKLGGRLAIEAMSKWWTSLLEQVELARQ